MQRRLLQARQQSAAGMPPNPALCDRGGVADHDPVYPILGSLESTQTPRVPLQEDDQGNGRRN